MLVSKSTKRGFGECPQCSNSYFNRRKPPNCEKFGYHPGGTNESPPRRNQSGTVQAPFFSWVRLTFLARRALRTSVFCSQQQCMDVRATFVPSGLAANSSCKHADLFFDAVPASFRRSICPPQTLRTTMETALHSDMSPFV